MRDGAAICGGRRASAGAIGWLGWPRYRLMSARISSWPTQTARVYSTVLLTYVNKLGDQWDNQLRKLSGPTRKSAVRIVDKLRAKLK